MAFCRRQSWWLASVQTSGLQPEFLAWLYSFKRIFSISSDSGLASLIILRTSIGIGIFQSAKKRKHSWSLGKLKGTRLAHVIRGLQGEIILLKAHFFPSTSNHSTLRPILFMVQPSELYASWLFQVRDRLKLFWEALSKEQKKTSQELSKACLENHVWTLPDASSWTIWE